MGVSPKDRKPDHSKGFMITLVILLALSFALLNWIALQSVGGCPCG